MTLNDLIRKANEMARQMSSGDVKIITDDWDDLDIELELVQDSFDKQYYLKVIYIPKYETL